jgi:hypothetical protein
VQTFEAPYNNSLDASGGNASRNLLGAAEGALIRAAASTQTLDRFVTLRMPETCKAKYRWTREQLTIAMRHHQATKLRRGVVLMMKIFSIVLLSFIGVVLLAWMLLPSTSTPPWGVLLLVIFCIYLLMFDRVNGWSWGRRFAKRPDADMEVEWEFSKKEIKTQSDVGEATLQWKGFLKVLKQVTDFFSTRLKSSFIGCLFQLLNQPSAYNLFGRS